MTVRTAQAVNRRRDYADDVVATRSAGMDHPAIRRGSLPQSDQQDRTLLSRRFHASHDVLRADRPVIVPCYDSEAGCIDRASRGSGCSLELVDTRDASNGARRDLPAVNLRFGSVQGRHIKMLPEQGVFPVQRSSESRHARVEVARRLPLRGSAVMAPGRW
ncbi:hypothetical protein GCM10022419_045570 [Nonomuraea rosea]|uniref:Uncharacterized protein n=1 Tax=Nonomuraea rosea TaxID=638574 RepID=A0ABP6X3L9_9ACTN